MRFWAKSVFLIIGKKLHIEGLENIKKNGKYILVANHSSLFDIMAIISFFPGVSWFGHARLLKIPVFRQILKMTDYVPMKEANIKNTKEMIDRLIEKSKGHTIAIFPEGTRTLDGKVSEFYRGFIHVLRASEINVLPVTLNGFFVLKPKNRFYINFNSRISVIIHEPLLREALIDKGDAEIIGIVKNIIESSLESYQIPENSGYSVQIAINPKMILNKEKKWVFIINPIAGNGFAISLVDKLKEMVRKYDLRAEMVYTAKKGHATTLSSQYAENGYSYIIGVGGDGTINEIAAPLISKKNVVTGLIAGGTGNDFIQITGFPDRFEEKDWEMFFKLNVIPMDVGQCNGKIFLNGMGLGFDAQVAAENYTEPGEVKRGGKNKYIWHILKTLLFFKEKKMIVISEGKQV